MRKACRTPNFLHLITETVSLKAIYQIGVSCRDLRGNRLCLRYFSWAKNSPVASEMREWKSGLFKIMRIMTIRDKRTKGKKVSGLPFVLKLSLKYVVDNKTPTGTGKLIAM